MNGVIYFAKTMIFYYVLAKYYFTGIILTSLKPCVNLDIEILFFAKTLHLYHVLANYRRGMA